MCARCCRWRRASPSACARDVTQHVKRRHSGSRTLKPIQDRAAALRTGPGGAGGVYPVRVPGGQHTPAASPSPCPVPLPLHALPLHPPCPYPTHGAPIRRGPCAVVWSWPCGYTVRRCARGAGLRGHIATGQHVDAEQRGRTSRCALARCWRCKVPRAAGFGGPRVTFAQLWPRPHRSARFVVDSCQPPINFRHRNYSPDLSV